MANNARHNISRASTILQGSATNGVYQGGKDGVEWTPTYIWKPTNPIAPLVFSAALAAGATSATLSANWAPPSGYYSVTLSTGQVIGALLTQGANTVTFVQNTIPQSGGVFTSGAVATAATANATVAGVPPVAGSANAYSTSAAIAAAGSALFSGASVGNVTINGTLYSGVGIPDVPRTVVGAWTTSSTVTVTGFGVYNNLMTETQTGTSFTGKKAFAVVTSITSSAAITAATFGTGNALGMPFCCRSGGFLGAFLNDVADAGTFVQRDFTFPTSSTTGDTRGTYTPAGSLNGAKFLTIEFKVEDSTTQIGAFGLTPA